MGILSKSSTASINRGFDYYKRKKVISFTPINEESFKGKVSGSDSNTYDVIINKEHTSKCLCNCPFAFGTRKICKHMVAMFFTIFPEEAKEYEKNILERQKEEERIYKEMLKRQKERKERITKYVNKLSKKELQEQLIHFMLLSESDYYDEDEDFFYNGDEFYYDDDCMDEFEEDEIEDNYPQVLLSKVVDAFEQITDFNKVYFNTITNDIYEISYAYPDEMNKEVENLLYEYNDKIIALPSRFELNNYQTMVDFIDEIPQEDIANQLYNSIKGKGAFSRFKSTLNKLNITNKWYTFKQKELVKKAKDFLIDNEIDFIDD